MTTERPHLGQLLNLGAQGDFKRVLFVCSGGMLRSATAAHWAASIWDWNTRNAGTMDAALPPIHANVVEWAEVIYCMEEGHAFRVRTQFPWAEDKIEVLGIPDQFHYRQNELIELLQDKLLKVST
jgi:predicted protein tyrosine phosphatase